MSKPRLLDLFCGAGGCTKGYQRAGFYVVGVDVKAQPNYCGDEFYEADALEVLAAGGVGAWLLGDFGALHASPPCQAFTQMSARWRGKGTKADDHLDLLTPTLEIVRELDMSWVVENVVGAKRMMSPTVVLHGGMFGLGVHRPRLFESNVMILASKSAQTSFPIGVYGTKPDGRTTYRYRKHGNMKGKSLIRAAKSIEEASAAMGIDWMTWDEIRESIPPAYTEHIGGYLLAEVERRGAVLA
jgi:DNA (cytosine-5)-methyltransferase 1